MKKILKLLMFILPLILVCLILLYHKNNTVVQGKQYKQTTVEKDRELIRFLRMPYANSLKVMDENYNFIMYLSEKTGYKIKLNVAKSYEEVVDIAKKGDADVIWTATNHYVENIDEFGDYTPIFRPVRHGNDKYRGIIITSNKSNINEMKDLKGKVFAFTDINSTSGYILPKALLENKYSIDIYSFFSDIKYLGSHDSVIENVYYGKVDAGAVFEDAPETILKERKNGVRILDRTEYILNEPIIVKKDISEKFKKIFNKDFIKNIPEQIKDDLSVEGFVDANEKEYRNLRKVLGYK